MQRALGVLVRLLEGWAIALMLAMAALVVGGVFFRYALKAPLAWYDEFAEFALVWVTFYGAVLAAHRRMHMGVETLVELLPAAPRRWMNALAEGLVFGLHLIIFYYGLELVRALEFDRAVSLPWVRLGWVYSAMPITGALMMLMSGIQIVRVLRGGPARPEG